MTIKVIEDLLEKDLTLKERTALPVEDITLLLEFCLKTCTFLSKVSSMNRSRAWLWIPLSFLL